MQARSICFVFLEQILTKEADKNEARKDKYRYLHPFAADFLKFDLLNTKLKPYYIENAKSPYADCPNLHTGNILNIDSAEEIECGWHKNECRLKCKPGWTHFNKSRLHCSHRVLKVSQIFQFQNSVVQTFRTNAPTKI